MGRAKALLPIEGQTFIERIVGALKQGGIERIIVVLGFNAEEIRRQIIRGLPVEIIVNPDYKMGQLSSLQVALRIRRGQELRRDDGASGRSSLHRSQACEAHASTF